MFVLIEQIVNGYFDCLLLWLLTAVVVSAFIYSFRIVNRQFHQNYFPRCPLSLFNGHPAANQNRVFTQTMV